MNKDQEKANAAKAAVEYLEEGMIIGLGTGSTAAYVIEEVGRLVSEGLKIFAIPTSEETEKLARKLNIPILTLDAAEQIDLTIDGADEFDPYLQLIKGGGGALLREKIIAYHSEVNIIIADSSKQVQRLGAFKLPVETIPFATSKIQEVLSEAGLQPVLRMKEDKPFKTDEGNYILDLDIAHVSNMTALDDELLHIPGVVETGLFLNSTDIVIMGHGNGVKIFERHSGEN
jgi:ribose 5-phosphate isomerase A